MPRPEDLDPKVRALRRFTPAERQLLKSLRFRDPHDAWTWTVWSQYVRAVAQEKAHLRNVSEWDVPDLMHVLSEAQAKALGEAIVHCDLERAEQVALLRRAAPTIVAARLSEARGARLKDDEPFTSWQDWQRLHEDDAGGASAS